MEVHFPSDAILTGNETEKLAFSLAGVEGRPAVAVENLDTIFKYEIARQTVQGGALIVNLAVKSSLSADEIGAKSIGSLGIEFQAQGVELRLQDRVKNPRVNSTYKIQIRQSGSQTVLGETSAVTRDGLLVFAKIPGTFAPTTNYAVDLDIARGGVLLRDPVNFKLVKELKVEKPDLVKLKDAKLVGKFTVNGSGPTLDIRFADETPDYKSVRTRYAIRISLVKGTATELLGQKLIDRDGLLLAGNTRQIVSLRDDLGFDVNTIAKLKRGQKIKVELVAQRTGPGFAQESQAIKVSKSVELTIEN